MASWDFVSVVEFTRSGSSNNFKISDAVESPGVLTDNNENAHDSTFTQGESLFVDDDPAGTFLGVYVDPDRLFIAVSTGSDTFSLYTKLTAEEADETLPIMLNIASIEDGPPSPSCFLAGTLIATTAGDRAVETLVPGDTVLDVDGRELAVRWLGRQTVVTRFGPPERLMPVRIRAGALGRGLPYADLVVTGDHALFLGGVLCNAAVLVNGTTIERVPLAELGDRYVVYHVETAEHALILANGVPAETFIDVATRAAFDNHADFVAAHGGETGEMAILPYPRVLARRQLPAALRMLTKALAAA